MRIIVIFITLISLASCKMPNQNKFQLFDKHIWKAMLDYRLEEYENSLQNFQQAFKIYKEDNSTNYLYAIASALHVKKIDEAKNLLKEAVIETSFSKEYFQNFEEYNKFQNTSNFKILIGLLENLNTDEYNRRESKIQDSIINTIIESDQNIRKGSVDGITMKRVDSVNVRNLIKFTEQYGWHDKGWILLWHQRTSFKEDNWIWNYFRPKINNEISKGNLRKDFWVIFEDQASIIDSKQQIYGSYLNNLDRYPIDEIEKVDSRRQNVGLPPLWYLEVVYHYSLPEGYSRTETYPFLNEYLKKFNKQ